MATTAENKNKNKKQPTTKPDLRQRYRRAGQAGSLAGVSKLWTALGRRPASRPGEELQCDLVDCSEYREANDGTRYLFCGIDVFSKYAWAWPLTSKCGTEMAGAMQVILGDMQDRPPLAVHSDKGTEMRAAPFQRLLKSRDIHFFTSENDDIKCAVVERFQRTLQGMMHHHMTANRTRRFGDVLPALLRTYNSTHHSAIGMGPRTVNWAVTEQVWKCLYSPQRPRRVAGLGSLQLASGDQVRMSKTRRQFAKGYKSHWSKEIFRVEALRDTSPVTYVVADAGGEPINGTFHGPELQKVTPFDYFDVESILDTHQRGKVTEYLVKWAGYPASFNSWERDVVRISGSPVMRRRRRPRAGRRRGSALPS